MFTTREDESSFSDINMSLFPPIGSCPSSVLEDKYRYFISTSFSRYYFDIEDFSKLIDTVSIQISQCTYASHYPSLPYAANLIKIFREAFLNSLQTPVMTMVYLQSYVVLFVVVGNYFIMLRSIDKNEIYLAKTK